MSVVSGCSRVTLEKAWLMGGGGSWCLEKILIHYGPLFLLRTWDMRSVMIMCFVGVLPSLVTLFIPTHLLRMGSDCVLRGWPAAEPSQ